MAVHPRLGGKGVVAGFGCFAFLSCVLCLEERTGGGGNRLVGMQGVHMYLLYCTLGMEGGYGDVYVCVILYMMDGYLMDTSS